MPLTVKTGAMKVKDPSTGNYVDVDMSLGTDYAPINSPALTGTPTAPTAGASTNTTQVATTAFVKSVTGTDALTTTAQTLTGAINELDAAVDAKTSANIVEVSGTEPEDEDNKIWLPLEINEGVQVPSWDEHQELAGIIGDTSMGTTATTVKGAVAELKDAINDIQEQITAYVETGNTSSRAYSLGDLLVWKGDLYRVKQTIASSGVAFTAGTNIELTTIGAELKPVSVSGTPDPTNTTDGSIYITRIGNLVFFDGYVVLNGAVAGTDAVLGLIPDGYRPRQRRAFRAYATYSNTIGFFSFSVQPNGEITTNTGGSTFTGTIYFPSISFAI